MNKTWLWVEFWKSTAKNSRSWRFLLSRSLRDLGEWLGREIGFEIRGNYEQPYNPVVFLNRYC